MRYLMDALAWLSSSANWSGPDGIAIRTAEHLGYTVAGVVLAGLVGIPIGWWVGHTRKFRGAAVTLTGVARALPTLGVVTLMGILLGIGLVGPMIAFVVLALPSVLSGAYTGVENVDPVAVDAARATGMTEMQVLTQVEIPLGMPLLVGGVRSAFLQVIATATLAAYVGAGGLGRFLFLGLKTQEYAQMLGSSLLVVALALVCDIAFAAAQHFSTPRGVRRES